MEKVKGTLYLNMILKEDEPVEMVKRSIDSVKDYVDGMYITVTYKQTKPEQSQLLDLLHKYKATVSTFKWTDSFADARNHAMSQVPRSDTTFIYWQDADDVLRNAKVLPKLLADAIELNHAAVFLTYWYAVELDKKGEVREILIEHKRERLIRNDDSFKWIGDLHELLIEQRVENMTKVLRDDAGAIVVHLTTPDRIDKNIERNISILEKQAAKEQHKDPRTIVYLGKGYYDRAMDKDDPKEKMKWFDRALVLFDEYLKGSGELATKEYRTGSGWPEERANTWQFVSEILKQKGDIKGALDANQEAINEAPAFPIYLIERSLLYSGDNDFKKAKVWLQLATGIDQPNTTIIQTPRDMRIKALEADLRIAVHENNLKQAKTDVAMMLEILPGNKNLEDKLLTIVSMEAANKASQSIVFLGKYLENIKEEDKIIPLLQAVPLELRQEKFYSEMAHKFIPPQKWEDDEIAILCGPGFEQWSPKSINKGIGGSEEAVIYLAQALNKLGWRVTVYANPMNEAGDHDGVTYKQWYDINLKDKFNVVILWRAIGFVDFKPDSKYTLLWMHDVPNNPEFTKQRLERVNKIAVLSKFHKSLFKMPDNGSFIKIPDEKFFLTANGISDMDINDWKGNPHRICYISSADRGLIYLLKHWDQVRKEVPDAELHIYYGFEMFDVVNKNNPERKAWKDTMVNLMKKPGITFHGRVSHAKLHEEINKCGIWAYPTDFEEISCISAMKAQRLGAVPVVTDYAALTETVKNGLKVDVDIRDKDGQKVYTDTLIKLLKDPKEQELIRATMMPYAKTNFGWERVAKQWNTLFQASLQTPEFFLQKAFEKNSPLAKA